MTISTTTRLFINQGNGATTVFPYDFLVPSADVFSVQLQDHDTGTILEVLTPSAYILTGVGNPAGGTVIYNPITGPIGSTVDIVGIRTMPFTQETVISNQGGFYPEAIEQQLDFIVMQIQQLAEEQARSLTVNPGQAPPDLQLLEDKVAEAENWADAAQTSANASAVSAAASLGSADDSADSATLAGQYANYPEDSQIPGHPGEFSALHFRNKCQAILDTISNTMAGWIHAAAAKTSLVDNDEFGLWDSVSGTLRKITLANFWSQSKWRMRGIGEIYLVDTSKTGVDIPPSSTTDTVWIELTAGLTGVGQFNNGKLSGESVTGTGALVVATSTIAYAGSPMNGQSINLLNSEGRIVRPSTSPGTVQNDQFQGHRLGASGGTQLTLALLSITGGATPAPYTTGSDFFIPVTDGTNGTPRTGIETRAKNIGVKAYMRIA